MTDLNDHNFDPATMDDDTIYIGSRRYVAVDAAAFNAERDRLTDERDAEIIAASYYRAERDALQAKIDEAVAALKCVAETTHHPVELIAIARKVIASIKGDET